MFILICLATLTGCGRLQPSDVTKSVQLAIGSDVYDGQTIEMTAGQTRPLKVTVAVEPKGEGETPRPLKRIDRWWIQGYVEAQGADPRRPSSYCGPMYVYGPKRKFKIGQAKREHHWYLTFEDDGPYPAQDMGEPVLQPTDTVHVICGDIPVPPMPGRYTLVVQATPYEVPPDRRIDLRQDVTRLFEVAIVVKPKS